jgi:hypothetical protein
VPASPWKGPLRLPALSCPLAAPPDTPSPPPPYRCRWNLYSLSPSGAMAPLLPMAAEFGSPPWGLGLRTYAPLPRSATGGRRLLLAGFSDPRAAGASLGVIDADAAALAAPPLDVGLSASRGWGVRVEAVGPGERGLRVVVAAGSPTQAQGIVMLEVGRKTHEGPPGCQLHAFLGFFVDPRACQHVVPGRVCVCRRPSCVACLQNERAPPCAPCAATLAGGLARRPLGQLALRLEHREDEQ